MDQSMTFDPVYGARTDDAFMQNLTDYANNYNSLLGTNLSAQEFDKMANPETYYARWGGGNPNTANTPDYTWNMSTGMKGLGSLNSYLQTTPDYTPTNASPILQSTPGLSSVFNPSGSQATGMSNIQTWLKPYMDQLKTMQTQIQNTNPTGSTYATNPTSFRQNPMSNSRGARYFNQNTNQYDTNTATTSDSF